MSNGLATRRALDRAARNANDELRGMQMLVVALGWAVLVLLAVAFADHLTGLKVLADLLRSIA